MRKPKVAIVCDWLTNVGGAEKVILRIHQLYPDAPIYTSMYDPKGIDWFGDAEVKTGWMQIFPSKLRRFLGPLRQIYFSHLDLSGYDLVISVTGAEAKAVRVPDGVHISYCHVPTQYYWQMYDDYLQNPGFGILNPLVRVVFRLLVAPLRRADFKSAQRPDYFVTISEYAKEQIEKYYQREAVVIHPPVEVDDFRKPQKTQKIWLNDGTELSEAYVVTSRQVNWKRVDLAVRAGFLADRHVVIIGEGPEHRKLVKMAQGSDLIQFLPLMSKDELAKYLHQARGFLFPSLEPFGIAPVEALAAGCPVIAFGEGGARDYVKDGVNGVLFDEQTPIALAEAMLKSEKMKFSTKKISQTADEFTIERFDRELKDFVQKCLKGGENGDTENGADKDGKNGDTENGADKGAKNGDNDEGSEDGKAQKQKAA